MRLFKSGDRVMKKNGGPVMQVIRYVSKDGRSNGAYTHYVECSWYDDEEKRHRKGVFHQYSLFKTSMSKKINVQPNMFAYGSTRNSSFREHI